VVVLVAAMSWPIPINHAQVLEDCIPVVSIVAREARLAEIMARRPDLGDSSDEMGDEDTVVAAPVEETEGSEKGKGKDKGKGKGKKGEGTKGRTKGKDKNEGKGKGKDKDKGKKGKLRIRMRLRSVLQ
jgi:chromatin remodeling complex protein RSC6